MTAEKLLQKIKKDTEIEIQKIKEGAKKIASEIINTAKTEAKKDALVIIEDGKKQSENLKRILLSKANQDAKRNIIQIKEEIIDECFSKAKEKLSKITGDEYKKVVQKIIKSSHKDTKNDFKLYMSRDEDKIIAENLKLKIKGSIKAIGGVILESDNGQVRIDDTFEGIITRKKDKIRVKIGKLLFS